MPGISFFLFGVSLCKKKALSYLYFDANMQVLEK